MAKKKKMKITRIKGERFEVASPGSEHLPQVLVKRPTRKRRKK